MTEFRSSAWAALPVALLACAAVGWAPETRSLQEEMTPSTMRTAVLIKGGAGLTSLAAIILFGLLYKFVGRDEHGVMQWSGLTGLVALVFSIAVAVFFGLAARQLLATAGRGRAQSLAVFVGVVTIVTGAAAELAYSPLFAAMLVGAVIANAGGSVIRDFDWFMSRSEQTVGMLFFLLAGVLLQPMLTLWGWLAVLAIVAVRLAMKPVIMRRSLRGREPAIGQRSALLAAPVRQSPIAVVLAVSLVLSESSPLNVLLLTIVVLIGLFCELLPFLAGWIDGLRNTESGAPPARGEGEHAGGSGRSART